MRLVFHLTAILLACTRLEASWIAQIAAPAWAVEDVWSPSPHDSNDLFWWQTTYPTGDVDRDGLTDLATVGTSVPSAFSGRSRWDLLRYSSGCRLTGQEDFFIPIPHSTIAYESTKLLLNTPSGQVVLLDDRSIPMIQAYDSASGMLLGSVPQPPPPAAGVPPTAGMEWLFPAGDVNNDGYDDAFYHTFAQPYGYCGLIDGATLTVVWQRYGSFVESVVLFLNGLATALPDLDGDGVSDLLFGQSLWNGVHFGHRVTAVSGIDGSTIWERVGQQVPLYRQACGRDLNSDGVGDLIVVLSDSAGPTVQAWSGRNGTVLWTQTILTVDPHVPSGWYGRNFSAPLMSQGVGSSHEEVILLATYIYNSAPDVYRLVHLDGVGGLLLDILELPSDIQPWSPDTLRPAGSTLYLSPVGDWDRDGFQEYATIISDPSNTPPWSSSSAAQLIFLGQQNLLIPANARIGSILQADLCVPSAPGFDFLLLASTTFDPAGGLTVQGWRTHLRAQDTLLQKTWTSRSLSGQLGPLGNGRLTLRLPNQPSLVGQRLYFRALVRNPVTGEVWTRSSLAQVDVLP